MTQRILPSDQTYARLELRDETGTVSAAVNDAGVGIDPMDLGRLFDSLFTTKPGGMGLGLAICKSIVEARGDAIWASPGAGRQTTFPFIMPGIQDGKGQCSSGG